MLGEGRTINVTGNACYIEYVENCYVNGIAKKKNDDDPAARMSDELKGERGLAVLKNLQKHGCSMRTSTLWSCPTLSLRSLPIR